ncbi:hypothetical protein VTK26DRAFT_1238 [Humicola hyalothermophila]
MSAMSPSTLRVSPTAISALNLGHVQRRRALARHVSFLVAIATTVAASAWAAIRKMSHLKPSVITTIKPAGIEILTLATPSALNVSCRFRLGTIRGLMAGFAIQRQFFFFIPVHKHPDIPIRTRNFCTQSGPRGGSGTVFSVSLASDNNGTLRLTSRTRWPVSSQL